VSRLDGSRAVATSRRAANESILTADCRKLREIWIGNKGGFLYHPRPAPSIMSHRVRALNRFQMPYETAWDLGALLIFDKIKPPLGGDFIWNLA
jgi:hypothetical protein